MSPILFYVESPFQLLQVYEAISFYEIDNYHIMVRTNNSDRNNSQIKSVVQLLGLSFTKYYKCNTRFNCFLLSLKLCWFSNLSQIIFIGDENSKVFRLVKRFVSHAKLVLLDDGVASINRGDTFNQVKKFSVFPGGGSTTCNDFKALSKFMISQRLAEVNPINLIVGSKLVEVDICSQRTYNYTLEKMVEMCDKNFPIIYVAHRDEEESNLGFIKEAYNLNVIKSEFPIELIANEINVRVHSVFTTISTALFSMQKVYPEAKFFIFRINSQDLKERKAAVEKLYDYMESMKNDNVAMVKLKASGELV